MSVATTSCELWKALRGILCLHKPGGIKLETFLEKVNEKVIQQLNESNPDYKDRMKYLESVQDTNGLVDYSSHPLVLGDAYEDEDFLFQPVNNISEFSSGLSIISVNAPKIHEEFTNQVFLKQYFLKMELGKATDNGFYFGKMIEKSTYDHLKKRPQILEKRLAKIRSSYQRDAFRQAGVQLKSKEAYQLAVKGLVRPIKEHEGYALMYGLECVNFNPPDITLKVTCVNESPIYLAEFCSELGLTLRTNAILKELQLVKYGPFTIKDALLPKHVKLQNVIDNLHNNFSSLNLLKKDRSPNLLL